MELALIYRAISSLPTTRAIGKEPVNFIIYRKEIFMDIRPA
jgi:hypothetical protein